MTPYEAGQWTVRVLEFLIVVGLVVAVVGAVVRNRNKSAQPAGFGILVSSDGHYWWDGNSWHDMSVSAPLQAPRSPDGAYWWDGKAWHLVPRNQ